jgi:NTE family protein
MTVAGKNKSEIPQSDIEIDKKNPTCFNFVVSEGSTVVFDLADFIKDKEINIDNIGFQSYRQIDSRTPVEIHKENDKFLWFTAPYVGGNEINTKLNFELTIADNDTSSTREVAVVVKRVHRAIIFQGGVSLGAYEAGVYSALVEILSKKEEGKGGLLENEKRPLFDIVVGASIGAMNGAIIVSNVIRHKSWEDSAKEVIEFWKDQESPTVADTLDMNPVYHYWWDIVHGTSKIIKQSTSDMIELYSIMNSPIKKWYDDVLTNWFSVDPNLWKDLILDGWYIPATAEASRRYYSAKQFDTFGALNVASGIIPWSRYGKFFDMSDLLNSVPRPDNKHLSGFSLRRTLEKFTSFPIKTNKDKGEPRLLLVTVDVDTGDAVTFDSYSDKIKYHNEENYITCDEGIKLDPVLASGTFPGFFDYPKFKVENEDIKHSKKENHIFWDGGFRSNTPLRELIQAHRDYWHKTVKSAMNEKDKDENDVPDLEVYIADLWPSELKEEPISFDLDFVENRKWGILFSDKTDYDEQVANFVTDYIDLTKQFRNLAESKGASINEIKHILDRHASSKNTKGQRRRFEELLGGRFRLTKVVRIDRKDDGNEVGNKIYDYSQTSIEMLMKTGYCDALLQTGIQSIIDEFLKLDDKSMRLENNNERYKEHRHIMEKLQQDLQKIQTRMNIEDGHDGTTIMNRVDNFISNVRSISDVIDHGTLKEEKGLVIFTANQFHETLMVIKNNDLQSHTNIYG